MANHKGNWEQDSHISFRLPSRDHRTLQSKADAAGVSLAAQLRQAVSLYLKQAA